MNILNPFRWWRARQARKRREFDEMYQASVDCLASMMKADAAKKAADDTIRRSDFATQRRRFRAFTSKRVH